jgi:hypothetical protein
MALAGAKPLSAEELPSTLQKAETPIEQSSKDESSDTSTASEDKPKQQADLVPPISEVKESAQTEATPQVPSPSQAESSNSQPKAKKQTDKTEFGAVDFEALIKAAPEVSPEPVTLTPPPTPKPKAKEEPEKAVKEEKNPQLDDSFYKDPLILEALAMFKGRLIKS